MFTGVYIVLNWGQLVTLGAERELGGEPGPVGGQGRQYQGGVRDAGVRTSKTLQSFSIAKSCSARHFLH